MEFKRLESTDSAVVLDFTVALNVRFNGEGIDKSIKKKKKLAFKLTTDLMFSISQGGKKIQILIPVYA